MPTAPFPRGPEKVSVEERAWTDLSAHLVRHLVREPPNDADKVHLDERHGPRQALLEADEVDFRVLEVALGRSAWSAQVETKLALQDAR